MFQNLFNVNGYALAFYAIDDLFEQEFKRLVLELLNFVDN